jgi:hypothetical protein
MTIVTSTHKDKLLYYLCSNAALEELSEADTQLCLNELELDIDAFRGIMIQFERFGFLEEVSVRNSSFYFILRIESHDFLQKGGFAIQDEIFKANIEKLGFEIDNLRKQLSPDKLDTLNKISSIASALFGGLALLPK